MIERLRTSGHGDTLTILKGIDKSPHSQANREGIEAQLLKTRVGRSPSARYLYSDIAENQTEARC